MIHVAVCDHCGHTARMRFIGTALIESYLPPAGWKTIDSAETIMPVHLCSLTCVEDWARTQRQKGVGVTSEPGT